MLNTDEYLHLAVDASSKNDHHAALNYLNNVLEAEPKNDKALLLIAAEYAELGLIDRALQTMKEALEANPELEIARFQLGLMSTLTNQETQAKEAFSHLIKHSKDAPLIDFSNALLALIDEDKATAGEHMRKGLSKDCENKSLVNDMTNLLKQIEQETTGDSAKADENNAIDSEKTQNDNVFLGAYRTNSLTEDE